MFLSLDSQIIIILAKALLIAIIFFYFVINVLVTNQIFRIDQNIKTSFGPIIVISSIIGTIGILLLMIVLAFA